jgi:nucleoside-diphosphate-sugar epimerase
MRAIVADVNPEVVIHLAASRNRRVDFAAFRAGYDANLLGTLNVIEACQEAPRLARLVHLGTCEEYGAAPVPFDETGREAAASAYGVSKLAATHLLQAVARNSSLPVVILRLTNVYGPGQAEDMFVPALIATLLRGRPFSMTAGQQTRDYVYVDDVVGAIVRAAGMSAPDGSVVNIGAGEPVRMKAVAALALRSIGPSAAGLLSCDRPYRAGESMEYWASTARALQLYDWAPRVDLEEGISRTVAAMRVTVQAE